MAEGQCYGVKITALTMKISQNTGHNLSRWVCVEESGLCKLQTYLMLSTCSEAVVQHPAFVHVHKRLLERKEPRAHTEETAKTLTSN